MDLEVFGQSDDFASEQCQLGTRTINEAMQLPRAGRREVHRQRQFSVEASPWPMIGFSSGRMLITDLVIDTVIVLEAKGTGGVVTSLGTAARLSARSGNDNVVILGGRGRSSKDATTGEEEGHEDGSGRDPHFD